MCRGAGWQRANIRVEELTSTLRSAFTAPGILPHFRQLRLEDWHGRWPTMHFSVHAKCWADGQHTCPKPGHVCLRRICSWVRHPQRATLRRYDKATRS